jgi:hypothetical protein
MSRRTRIAAAVCCSSSFGIAAGRRPCRLCPVAARLAAVLSVLAHCRDDRYDTDRHRQNGEIGPQAHRTSEGVVELPFKTLGLSVQFVPPRQPGHESRANQPHDPGPRVAIPAQGSDGDPAKVRRDQPELASDLRLWEIGQAEYPNQAAHGCRQPQPSSNPLDRGLQRHLPNWAGKGAALPSLPPLGTGRASFPASGSSLYERPSRDAAFSTTIPSL